MCREIRLSAATSKQIMNEWRRRLLLLRDSCNSCAKSLQNTHFYFKHPIGEFDGWWFAACIAAISTPFSQPERPMKKKRKVKWIRCSRGDSQMNGRGFCLLCYRIIIAIDFFALLLLNFPFISPLSSALFSYLLSWYRYYFLHRRVHYTHFSLVGRRQAAASGRLSL